MNTLTMFDARVAQEVFTDLGCLKEVLKSIYNRDIDIKEIYQDGIIMGDEEVCGVFDLHIVDMHNRHFLLKIQNEGKDMLTYVKHIHLLDRESIRRYGDLNHIVPYDVISISLKDYKTNGYFMIVGKLQFVSDLGFDDGVRYIFINHEYCQEKSPLGKIVHDMNCSDPQKMYNLVLKERFCEVIKKYY